MKYAKWLAGVLLAAALLLHPGEAAYGAGRAMARWYETVAPSLFPFLVLMPLLTGEAAVSIYERLLGRGIGRLFGLPGSAAAAMIVSAIAGTPAGAHAARRSDLNKGQLQRVAVAMMGFSPAFFISGVGSRMLGSSRAGWALLLVQLLTQLTLLAVLRGAWKGERDRVPAGDGREANSPVRSAVGILLGICGYMALFGSVSSVMGLYIGRNWAEVLLCLLDAPSGALLVAQKHVDMGTKLVALSFICGFGGICLLFQCLEALKGCGIKAWKWLAIRVGSGAISAGYMLLALKLGKFRSVRLAIPRGNPMAVAGLLAALLAIPVLIKIKKSIS